MSLPSITIRVDFGDSTAVTTASHSTVYSAPQALPEPSHFAAGFAGQPQDGAGAAQDGLPTPTSFAAGLSAAAQDDLPTPSSVAAGLTDASVDTLPTPQASISGVAAGQASDAPAPTLMPGHAAAQGAAQDDDGPPQPDPDHGSVKQVPTKK